MFGIKITPGWKEGDIATDTLNAYLVTEIHHQNQKTGPIFKNWSRVMKYRSRGIQSNTILILYTEKYMIFSTKIVISEFIT